MSIIPPVVGVTPGPEWASDINNILETNIAEHTHTTGAGVQLTQAALNITSTLPMNNQALGNSKAVQLTAQATSPAFAGSVFNTGGNLYFRNGSNVDVQITNGSSLSGVSVGSITGLPASGGTAAYLAGVFYWQKNNGTGYASMVNGDVKIYDSLAVSPAFGVSLKSPIGLPANYECTLPRVTMSLPTTKPTALSPAKVLTMSAAGAVEPTLYKTLAIDIPTGAASNAGNTVLSTTFTGTDKPITITIGPDTATNYFATMRNTVAAVANTAIVLDIVVRLGGNVAKQFKLRLQGLDPDNTGAANLGVKYNPSVTWNYTPTAGETSSGLLVEVITFINGAPLAYNGQLEGARLVIREVIEANTL